MKGYHLKSSNESSLFSAATFDKPTAILPKPQIQNIFPLNFLHFLFNTDVKECVTEILPLTHLQRILSILLVD
jgi:hypothetical protein